MREFTNLSVHPGWQITVDGETYLCPDFTPPADLQGSARIVPKDRILFINWVGQNNHGSIEGLGVLEGFFDKSQLAPYVSAWLKARVAAKTEKVASLVRMQQQIEEQLDSMAAAEAGLKENMAVLDAKRDANQLQTITQFLARHQDEMQKIKARLPLGRDVVAAQAELATAQMELDADNAQA